jgi:hypothetical protein
LCDLNRGNKWSFEPDANLFGSSKIMSRGSAAEAQVVSGDQTTGTVDDSASIFKKHNFLPTVQNFLIFEKISLQ